MSDCTKISLANTLLSMAAIRGDAPAVVGNDIELTFRQLAERCAQTGHELIAAGIQPGQHVGIAVRDSVEYLISIFGIWMADAVAVPIDFRSSIEERQRIASAFDLAAILQDRPATYEGCEAMLIDAAYKDRRATRPVLPPPMTGPDAPAYISLTSGTTGTPLGFVISHGAMLAKTEWDPYRYLPGCGGPRELDLVTLNALPLSFSAARTHVFARLLSGGKTIFFPMMHTLPELAEAMQRHRVEFSFTVPTVVRGLMDLAPDNGQPFFPDLKLFYIGGANLNRDEKLAAQKILTPHAMTNYASTASGTLASLYGDDMRARPDTEGRVLSSSRIEIVDGQDTVLRHGEQGILRVRAPGMATHIYGGQGREDGDKIRAGWIYPGDIASIDTEGFLSIHGRQSDLIIRGGANVYPSEVEAAIAALPGVREVAVIGFETAREGEEIAAFVVVKDGITQADIDAHCRRALTSDKRPREIVILDALPRNTNGKVLKRDLSEMVPAGKI